MKELEESIANEGENDVTARLRVQEEIHQSASVVLSVEVSTDSVMQTTPTHLYILYSPLYILTPIMRVLHEGRKPPLIR